jgi:anti-anti-sigma regulatory factor
MIDFRLEDTTGGPRLKLCGDLTIENGERLKTILIESIKGRERLFLDLSEATAVDVAGFQILYSAFRTGAYSEQGPTLFESLPGGLKQAAIDGGYAQRDGAACRVREGEET